MQFHLATMDSKAAKSAKKKERKNQKNEEMRYYKELLDKLATDDTREQIAFPPTLDKGQRKKLHTYAHSHGLKSKSSGTGEDRFLIVYKKSSVPFIPTSDGSTTYLRICEGSIKAISDLVANDPIDDEEKTSTILRSPNESHSSAHLPFMFGNSNSKTRLTCPPLTEPTGEFKTVRQSLPIYEYRSEILDAINKHQVVVISGETGSGKTTQVPQYIMEECSINQQECRIICTQPRRLAATSIATRISQERNDTLGRSVGYQIRLDSRVMPTTNLILTTSGFLLRCLTGSKQEDVYKNLTHLILDEVHEREKVTDFLLIAIKDALQVNPRLKIILMSATLDSEQFSQYFENCPVINVPGRLFDVETIYLGDVLLKTEYKTRKMNIYMAENQGPKILRSTQTAVENNENIENIEISEKSPQIEIPEDDKQFYDECFEECLAQDDDTAFEQIFCLINDENMPIDYKHSAKGRTALGIASEKGLYEVVTKLLDLGADPSLTDFNGKTPLNYAEENEQDDCCELLAHYATLKPITSTMPQNFDNDADAKAKALKQFTLAAYQMTNFSMKSNEIDHELLQHVIKHIHTHNSTDGSILVFLPGYEDIMTQKDMIETRFTMNNYQLFVLHSGVNGTNAPEQARVFDRMPTGIRKIILSTNIAETSLTINDVVYVIDAGKVKQQSYDSISESTCLTSTDISQACAKQRAGRAGRIQNGFCYRLYSLEQYEAMEKYTLPEILRVPLTEICLNAKILSGKLSIEEFLLKALQPPSVKNIRQSIELLKKINALDTDENITHLGIHLANMPVDCQLGKMILYSIVLRCLDPVVTIVSALSVKDPFTLPVGGEGEKINKIKKQFANSSLSDHQMLLNTFEMWSKQKRRGEFCAENYISNGNMQMIQGLRRLIMGHLKMAQFISDDSARNPKKLNENSLKWEIVKGCLTAGLYPNICRISNLGGQIFSKQDKKLAPHLSSIIRERRARGQIDPNVFNTEAEWLVHGEKSRISNFSLIRNITFVPAIDVILFGGPINLPEENLSPASENRLEFLSDADCDDIPDEVDILCNDDDDDDDQLFGMPGAFDDEMIFSIDDWINFIVDQNEATLLFQLRLKFSSMISRFLRNHFTFQPKNQELRMLAVLVTVIQQEDSIEQKIKAIKARIENEDADDDDFIENPDLMWNGERKSIPEQQHSGPMITSAAYTQAIQPEHQRNKKKKKNRNKNEQTSRFAKDKKFDNWRKPDTFSNYSQQSTTDLLQPSTSRRDPQQRLTQGLFNNIDTTFTAPIFPNMGFSQPGFVSTLPTNDLITNRYFLLTVKNVGQMYANLSSRRWLFSTPLNQMRKIAREAQPASKIILLFHVQKKSAIFSTGQFLCQNSGSYRIKLDRECEAPFKPLVAMEANCDFEMPPDQGFETYNMCLDFARSFQPR